MLTYLSVCSGIEAASVAWQPLGWKALAFSEIEAFPSAVLAHHYPDVPNFGDMTRFQEWPDLEPDVLVGGTPCQSFSVAGLRKGLDDPRGNLTLTFLAIADKYKPAWIVWENVPGVISDRTGALEALLDGLEELGYVLDIDILDAQFFGVPQRRRRVFVCGQHRDDLLRTKTDSSALTIAQCWLEILHGILVDQCSRSVNGLGGSDSAYLSRDGVKRRMRLFGLDGDAASLPTLRENLIAALARCRPAPNGSAVLRGASDPARTQGGPSKDSLTALPSTLTAQSLSVALGESYEAMRSFITSTATSSITPHQIYSCSQAVLLIAELIQRLRPSCPSWWSAASSALTSLKEYTNYARSTSSDLFGDMERVSAWGDFIRQAERTSDALGSTRVGNFGEVLPLADCLSGNPAPRREAGKAAPTIPSRSTAGGGLGTDFDCDGGLIPSPHTDLSPALKARDSKGPSSDGDGDGAILVPMVAPTLQAGGNSTGGDRPPGTTVDTCDSLIVTHSLRGEGFDASEDGTGRGTPLVPVQPYTLAIRGRGDSHELEYRQDGTANALLAPNGGRGGIGVGAVAFAQNQRDEVRVLEVAGALAAEPGMKQQTYVAFAHQAGGTQTTLGYDPEIGTAPTLAKCQTPAVHAGMQVRRLTPVECARLQGFPDDYLDITYRGRPAADGPKYRALGNSMAVPCMAWLGRRIQMVEDLCSTSAAWRQTA